MRNFGVSFSQHADADFDSILHFIARDNPLRALSFVDELQERIRTLLSAMPNAGRREGEHRLLPIGRYVVVYAVDEEAELVRVLMVSEGHREWRAVLESRR